MKQILILLIVLIGMSATPARAESSPDQLSDLISREFYGGHRIHNLTDDFLAFWDRAAGTDLPTQRRLWRKMVESKHPEYFERAVYRNASRSQRAGMLDYFLMRLPERIESIRRFSEKFNNLDNPVLRAVMTFRGNFPSYVHHSDIYIGLSLFTFDGSVRPVFNDSGIPDTLCLGIDVVAEYTPEQLRVVLLHELFHLYHFGFLFRNATPDQMANASMPLMIEGMAVAAVERMFPWTTPVIYLNFNEDEFVMQEKALAENSGRFLNLIKTSALPAAYEPWFSVAQNPGVPPRGGYLLGYEVTRRLLANYTLDQMVRMSAGDLREHAEEQLGAMTSESMIMKAPSSISPVETASIASLPVALR